MAIHAKLSGVSVDYPIYNANGRSLKRSVLALSTGGLIGQSAHGDRVVVQALRDITFDLKQGDRVGLVGSNGAGKTTLLRVVAGVYEPVEGRVEVSGRVASLFDLTLGMDPEATGEENIVIRGLVLGLSPERIQAKREEIARFTELGDFLAMPIRTYSAGMQLRLAFAISTSITPDILLMDEWISVGDAAFVSKAEARARELVGEVGIMMIASHSNLLIQHLCNRVIWLEKGRVVQDGPADEVLAAYAAATADKQAQGEALPA